VQSYAHAVRAFFHWLVCRETLDRNPFDRVAFPKVGKPLIRIIEPEEFERLLQACTPPERPVRSATALPPGTAPPSGCSTIQASS
jgi:site-specific recombinase XerD